MLFRSKIKILVIDDDDLVVRSLKNVLTKIDYDVEICLDAGEADGKIQEYNPDIILLDIYLTTHNGIELLKQFKQSYPEIPIIMITGFSDVKTTVTAIKSGAFDFLLKPMELDYLKFVLGKAAEEVNLRSEVNKLQLLLKENKLSRDYFGKSRAIVKVLNFVEKLAKSSDTTILIEGESGTGKEVIAKYIYQNSPRANSPFIQINCSTIPNELAESELFGHERGAFTGAQNKTKLGKFELANGGTLLLDEIGDLNIDLQAKLLRVLQEKKFFRLGGQKEISVNVRILTATNKNLEDEVMKGNFREDLFYRLNVAKVHLPPLRERKGDIPLFAHVFLKEFSKKFNKKVKRITPEAIELFMSMGDEVIPRCKRTLLSEIFTNIFWGVTTPAQAILMLGGFPPPTSKELVGAFKKAFFDTKMIEKKYVDFLEKVVKTWKDYEQDRKSVV